MMGARKGASTDTASERRSARPPAQHSEARVRVARKWSPTQPSAVAPAEPDPLSEAHAALAEARAALDAAVLALDRIRRRAR